MKKLDQEDLKKIDGGKKADSKKTSKLKSMNWKPEAKTPLKHSYSDYNAKTTKTSVKKSGSASKTKSKAGPKKQTK